MLTAIPTAQLTQVRDGVREGRLQMPLSEAALLANGVREHRAALVEALGGYSRLACEAIIDAALAERAAQPQAPELVWTGPEGPHTGARDTAVVVRNLFERARTEVILGGYCFDAAQQLLAPLHTAMTERGVQATFFINIDQPASASTDVAEHLAAAAKAFVSTTWPFGRPFPALYCDSRALHPRPYVSMHAKCVVVDRSTAFVSSANFTARGQTRNIETGVLIQQPSFAAHLANQWLALVANNLVTKLTPSV